MQARQGRGRCFKPSQEFRSPGLKDRHLLLNGGAGDARLDGFDQSAYLTVGLFEIARGAVAVSVLFGPLPIDFSVEFVDEGRDQFWLHQLMLKPIQDRGFEPISAYREEIVAGSFVASGGAAVMRLADLREPAAAGSAFQEAGE